MYSQIWVGNQKYFKKSFKFLWILVWFYWNYLNYNEIILGLLVNGCTSKDKFWTLIQKYICTLIALIQPSL